MARVDLAGVEQGAHAPRCQRLPLLRAQGVDARVQRHVAAEQRVCAGGGGHLGGPEQTPGVTDCEHTAGLHDVRAIDERQPLLGAEDDGRQARAAERFAARQSLASVPRLAFAQQHQTQVRQGREIAAGAHRAAHGHDGRHARVEEVHEQPQQLYPHAGMPAREAMRQEQHDGADRRDVEGIADAAGMAANQIALQGGEVRLRNLDAAEMAEASSDAVDRAIFRHQALHQSACHADTRGGGGREPHQSGLVRYRDDVHRGQELLTQGQRLRLVGG